MDTILFVRPDELRSKAAAITKENERISSLLETARVLIDDLSSAWDSEGARMYRRQFAELYPKLMELTDMMKKYTRDVESYIDIIRDSDKSVVNQVETLPVFR